MEIFRILTLSSAGMSAQRARMSVTSANLANTETTRTPEGGPYRRRDVLFQALPLRGPAGALVHAGGPAGAGSILTVEVAGVRESQRPFKRIYDPGHPDAGLDGYVSYPDINTMEELVDLMAAVRSYEANLATFNATKTLIRRLLELGQAR